MRKEAGKVLAYLGLFILIAGLVLACFVTGNVTLLGTAVAWKTIGVVTALAGVALVAIGYIISPSGVRAAFSVAAGLVKDVINAAAKAVPSWIWIIAAGALAAFLFLRSSSKEVDDPPANKVEQKDMT